VAQAALVLSAVLAALLWPLHAATEVLPSLPEAARRALLAVAAAGLVAVDAWLCGEFLLWLLAWQDESWQERSLFRLALGFGALSYLSLALAVAGWYRPPVVATLLALVAIGGIAKMGSRTALGSAGPPMRSGALTPGAEAGRVIWTTICAVAVAIALVSALAPEVEYDALWYHLWLPKVWLQHGHPVDIPTEYISLYPLTWELIFGAGLAVAGPIAAKLLHFACLPLASLAVWQFMRRFFATGPRWLACAIVLTVPMVLWEATTAYVDLALAVYVTLGLYALLAFLDTRERSWFAVAAICLGLGAAVKHLGLIVVAAAASALLLDAMRRRAVRPRHLVAPIALAAIALLVAAPWYLRAWLASGNPFFPEMYKLFGAWPATRWDAVSERGLDSFKAHFGMPRTPVNLLLLPWNVTVHGALFGGCVGPVFLLALPALVWVRARTRASAWLAWVVLGYLAVWASPVSSFQLRFLVPILPALAMLTACALGRLIGAVRSARGQRVTVAAVAALLALNLPPFIPLHEGDRAGWTGWMTHVIREVPLGVVVGRQAEDVYLRRNVPSYGAWRYAASQLPAGARVLEFGGGDNLYATRDRVSMDAPIARDVWSRREAGMNRAAQALAHLGITHVLFDRRVMPQLEAQGVQVASADFRSRVLSMEYEDEGAMLYRVR
jgi:hypothetical protein